MTRTSLIIALTLTALLTAGTMLAQTPAPARYVDAAELTLVGKMMDTPNPFWRVDTARFQGFTSTESKQVRCGAGLAVAFRTDSPFITLQFTRRPPYTSAGTMVLASTGFDLYIREGRDWIWAANAACKPGDEGPARLVSHLDRTAHDCLLYLPIHTELYSLALGVAEGSTIEPLPNPFRNRIVFCGSSFTHGGGTSRPGMTYPLQFERHTGLQVLPLGCGGNGRLQPHLADVMAAVEADAFVFDQFSNPTADEIRERFFPFLEKVRTAHPGVPIIFQQTIGREKENYDMLARGRAHEKRAVADSVMAIAMAQDPDLYYLRPDANDATHEWTVDGTHPSDHGYTLWARSIERPLRRILRRYGIR